MSDEQSKSMGFVAAAAAIPVVFLLGLPLILGIGADAASTASTPSAGLAAGTVPSQYAPFVVEAGTRCPPKVTSPAIAAQAEAESGWNPSAQSPAGAQGLTQFMPGTWATWGKDYDHNGKISAFDPADAIGSQADFMCSLATWVDQKVKLGIIKGDPLDLALAAYNAGSGNVEKYGGIPPFTETQDYVTRIRSLIPKYTLAGGGVPQAGGNSTIVAAADQWLGYPYVWGGGDLSGSTGIGGDGRGPGFDCSGLVRYAVFKGAGIDLARIADAQARDPRGVDVPRDFSKMRAGDIVGFSEDGSGLPGTIGHIGIYIGGGKMIHAPSTGKNVEIVDLKGSSYYAPMAWKIKRFTL